jgi:hypothetical protein
MFLAALIGWVFFRATDFAMARRLLATMFTPTAGAGVPEVGLVLLVLSIAAWWSMVGPNAFDMDHEKGWRWRVALAASFGASLALIAGGRESPFLYFQF